MPSTTCPRAASPWPLSIRPGAAADVCRPEEPDPASPRAARSAHAARQRRDRRPARFRSRRRARRRSPRQSPASSDCCAWSGRRNPVGGRSMGPPSACTFRSLPALKEVSPAPVMMATSKVGSASNASKIRDSSKCAAECSALARSTRRDGDDEDRTFAGRRGACCGYRHSEATSLDDSSTACCSIVGLAMISRVDTAR